MLFERALAISRHTLGEGHEDTIVLRKMVEMVSKQVSAQESAVGSSTVVCKTLCKGWRVPIERSPHGSKHIVPNTLFPILCFVLQVEQT